MLPLTTIQDCKSFTADCSASLPRCPAKHRLYKQVESRLAFAGDQVHQLATWLPVMIFWSLALGLATLASPDTPDSTPPPTSADTSGIRQTEQETQLDAAVQLAFKNQEFLEARKQLKRLLELRQRIYPQSEFPHGHPKIAACLQGLGTASRKLCDYENDLLWNQKHLAMCRQLYPVTKFPIGHESLALALDNLGIAHYFSGDINKAEEFIGKAEKMLCDIQVVSGSPKIIPYRAACLANLGRISTELGKYQLSCVHYGQFLELCKKIFPPTKYPRGHVNTSLALIKLGCAYRLSGDCPTSEKFIRQSLKMNRKLFPTSEYPNGHPKLANSFRELGLVELMLGNSVTAQKHLERALAMERHLSDGSRARQLSQATILDGLLMAAVSQCRFSDAQRIGKQIEAAINQLYPASEYPMGHRNIAGFSLNIGLAYQRSGELEDARRYYLNSLSIWKRLYQPDGTDTGHPRIVEALYYLGNLYQDWGRLDQAYAYYDAALKMARSLFPKEQYPNGNSLLSVVLQNMANHCWLMGETETAANHYREVLRINEALYPTETEYPDGHPILHHTYIDWANFLAQEQQYLEAELFSHKALAIAEAIYPVSDFPDGHPDLAKGWRRLGSLMGAQGRYAEAQDCFEKSLACYEQLLSQEGSGSRSPIAYGLADLGWLHHAAGNYDQAETYLQRALSLYQQVYPDILFEAGHPALATCLRQLGQLLNDTGDPQAAFPLLAKSTRMECDLVASMYDGGSDAQLLNVASRRLASVDHLISAWRTSSLPASELYASIWYRRGLLTRLITQRQQIFKQAVTASDRALYDEYVSVKRGLSRALFVSSGQSPADQQAQIKAIGQLNQRKEELERQLGRSLDQDTPLRYHMLGDHTLLAQEIPHNSVFIDYLQYVQHYQAPAPTGRAGHHTVSRMAAFLITPNRPVQFIDLGDADTINHLVQAWRDQVLGGHATSAGHELRKRIWDPVQQLLPPATQTVYVCPDGSLSLVAWGALPRRSQAGILLEDLAFAVVLDGPSLLKSIRDQASHEDQSHGNLLTVGDVDYGQSQSTIELQHGLHRVQWTRLTETGREAEDVVAWAKTRDITLLTGDQATTERLLASLPNARWAHLATHGFYVDQTLKNRLRLASADPLIERLQVNPAKTSILGRNPFVRSGLILAKVNEPTRSDPLSGSQAANGILTAETICSLDCHRLELVVLSACQTGLGELAPGDGVFSMRRAFHVAGARNVVASLWQVEDVATMRLMAHFYRFLWQENLSPLEALRQAQLMQFRSAAEASAPHRGPALNATVPLVTTNASARRTPAVQARKWAGFQLSGPGF